MRIAIYSRHLKDSHVVVMNMLLSGLRKRGFDTVISEDYFNQFKPLAASENITSDIKTFRSSDELEDCDFLFTIGGDGTILDTLQHVVKKNLPVAGINTGRLGFLADINPAQIDELLNSIEKNTYSIEKRSLLHVDSNKSVFGNFNFGLNEFSIHKTDSSSMIVIHVYINGAFLNSYWADGLIMATPTGSTAYSLSCGGPVIFPESSNFVITPVSPHNLSVRPMVIPDNVVVSFQVEGRSPHFLCALDSRYQSVDIDCQIAVRKMKECFRLMRLPDSHYLKTLREKLRWGEDTRN